MFKIVKLFLVILLVCSFQVVAQEWGEISDKELAMTGIAEDPEADAVVLFDIGKIIITPDWNTVFTRHKRIKILTEKGKNYANIEIPFWHENDINELEAQSFLPNGDDFELDDDNVYEEEGEKWKVLKFAIPGVEVGSVIEYKYELFSEYFGFLQPWYFQGNEFTKRSELKVYKPNGFNYNAFKTNTDIHNIEFIEGEEWNPYQVGQKIKTFKWVITDLPGIKEEPYMNNLNDYLAHITFQIASFKNQYVNRTYIKSWDDIAKEVRDSYDHKIEADDGVDELVQSLISGVSDKKEIIKKLYDFVCCEINTDDKIGFLNPGIYSAEQTLEEKKGNKVEKNLLLISMFKNAGFDVYPVLISTKTHGAFYPHLVNLRQFNHMIACVNIDNENIFLDTRDKYCPMSSLPISSCVNQGFIVKSDAGQVITIKKPELKNVQDVENNIILDIDGSVTAESKIRYEGYMAMSERKKINNTTQKEYIEDFIDDYYENAILDTFIISNLDSIYKPLEITLTFKIPEYAQIVENMVYFAPVLLTKKTENPFKRKKRNFPVDYSYTISESEISKITIPPSFKITELPPKTRAKMPKISFLSLMLKSENTIEITRNFRIRRTSVNPHEYQKLKILYDKMVEADDSQIILEKI
jgi:hypothetical protein